MRQLNSHFLLAPDVIVARPWSHASARSLGWRPHRARSHAFRPIPGTASASLTAPRFRPIRGMASASLTAPRFRPIRGMASASLTAPRFRPIRGMASASLTAPRFRPIRGMASASLTAPAFRPIRGMASAYHGLNAGKEICCYVSPEQIAFGLRQSGTNTPRIEGGCIKLCSSWSRTSSLAARVNGHRGNAARRQYRRYPFIFLYAVVDLLTTVMRDSLRNRRTVTATPRSQAGILRWISGSTNESCRSWFSCW